MSGGTFGTNWLDLSSTSNRYTRTYIQGFMDISGGNLIVRNNNLYLTQGDASINGNLLIGYDTSLNKRLFVGSDASFGGKLFVTRDLSVNGNVSGNVNTMSSLIVSNNINMNGVVAQFSSDISVPSTYVSYIDLSGYLYKTSLTAYNLNNINVLTPFYVDVDVSFNGRLFLSGDASFNKRLFVGSDSYINGLTLGKGNGNISTNTAFGFQALSSNTNGTLNTAIGYQAMISNTSGSENTAVGTAALDVNTTGNYNTAMGQSALGTNITGNYNTAIGALSLYYNTASENTALGSQSLFNTSSGQCNTAVGSLTLVSNTTGSNNVAVGFEAIRFTTGGNNTALGHQAGNAGTANTTGTNNTYIGYQAQANANNYSNSTALGSGATITASNQVVLGTSTETVITVGDASLNKRLFVSSDVSFGGNLYVAKNIGIDVSGSFGVYDVCNNAQMVVDISGGVNLRGPVMSGLTLPDQSVMMTAAPPLDSSNNLGTVWKQATSDAIRNWTSVSVSANGQYQTANDNGGYIYTSNNFGSTWRQATSFSAAFDSVSISANGQYQTTIVNNGYIYRSNDYGVTWTQTTSDTTRNWRDVSISATGQYQTAIVNGGYIYTSNNYGVTWTQATSDATRSWREVTISATGQYQTAIVNGGYIYTSNNYGVTWRQATSDATRQWYCVFISNNGQYQTAGVYSGYLYSSSDYGVSWSQVTSDATRIWHSISMTANGQYQIASIWNGYIWVSSNYGKTWKQASSDSTRQTAGISMSSNGQYITAIVTGGYIYQSITPYNDLVVQNSLISYGDVSFNRRLFVGSDASINGLNVGRGTGNISSNTVFGYQALNSNTTGGNIVAVGFQSLFLNSTGSDNSSFGYQSLFYNTGSLNTAVGKAALLENRSGNNNTAVGYQAGTAGTSNTTGSNNTYIGYQAQANGNNYTNSTALGSGATITASNQVVLGTSTETVIAVGDASMNKRLFVASDASFGGTMGFTYSTPPTFTSSHIGYYVQSTIAAQGCSVINEVYTILLTITGLVGVYIINIDTDLYTPGSFGGGGVYYTGLFIKDGSTTLSNCAIGWGGTSANGYCNRNASLTAFIKSNNNTITFGYASKVTFSMNTVYYRYMRIA